MAQFCSGFLKVAFGPQDAAKVLQLAKKRQLPKASSYLSGGGLAAAPSWKGAQESLNYAKKVLPGLSSTPGVAEAIRERAASPQARLSRQVSSGKIIPGESAGVLPKKPAAYDTALIKAKENYSKLSPDDKKMTHAVFKGHELDELQTKPGISAGGFGHRSPDVIFRESNRVATLPKENEKVRDFMIGLRKNREASALFPKGLEYGKQRLSRHARRRLAQRAESMAAEQANRMLGGANQPS